MFKPVYISDVFFIKFFFLDWLQSRGETRSFEEKSAMDLDKMLQTFYGEVRDKKGNMYQKNTYVGIRYAINRQLKESPWNRAIDLKKDKDFLVSNKVFNGMLRKLKMEGLDKTVHKAAIEEEDWKKLINSSILNVEEADGLQKKVFLDIMLHFGRRGREGLCDLKKDSFTIVENENGGKHVQMAFNEMEKTKQGIDKDEGSKEAIMCSQEENCPVESFEAYMSHLHPEEPSFFTKSLKKKDKDIWFGKQKMGKNKVGNMMKQISKEACLSKIYTNHCLRATTATILARSGVQDRDIAMVTGHKNVASLQHYVNAPTTKKMKSLSSIWHNKTTGE